MSDQAVNNPIEEQRKQALEHYTEASNSIHHWSSFVEAAIKAYNPQSAGQGSEGVVTIEQIVQECDRRYPIVDEEIFDDTYRSYHEYTEAQSELRKAFDEGADFVLSHQPLPVSPYKPTSEGEEYKLQKQVFVPQHNKWLNCSDGEYNFNFDKYKRVIALPIPVAEKDYIDTVGKCANCGVEFHIHKEEKEIEQMADGYVKLQGHHDKPEITKHDFIQGYKAVFAAQDNLLKIIPPDLYPNITSLEGRLVSIFQYLSVLEAKYKDALMNGYIAGAEAFNVTRIEHEIINEKAFSYVSKITKTKDA